MELTIRIAAAVNASKSIDFRCMTYFAIAWPERTLFTHVGRWACFSNPDDAKFTNCSVRSPRWHLVSIKGDAKPAWELYDLPADPGEKQDVAGQHSDVVAKLSAEYDTWWIAARAGMVGDA